MQTDAIGPALARVSARYAGEPKGLETIMSSLKNGVNDKWGKIEMPPQTHLSEAQMEELARWVLTLAWEGSENTAKEQVPEHSALISEKREGTVIVVGEEPVVYRTYLPDAEARAIAVGLPSGISYAYDPVTCHLLYVWQGGFLDMEKHWTGHGGWYAELLGEKVYEAPQSALFQLGNTPTEQTLDFKGYRLREDGPEFSYLLNGQKVTHHLRFSPDLKTLTHHFQLPGNTQEITLKNGRKAADPESFTLSVPL